MQWISVKNYLPDNGQKVVVTNGPYIGIHSYDRENSSWISEFGDKQIQDFNYWMIMPDDFSNIPLAPRS